MLRTLRVRSAEIVASIRFYQKQSVSAESDVAGERFSAIERFNQC